VNRKTSQLIAIFATIVLVLVFYFGCSRVDPKIANSEKSRSANFSVTSIENIRKKVFDSLNVQTRSYYNGLVLELENSESDSAKVEALKNMSGFWYRIGEYALAGNAAEEIANINQDDISWSIAATTYGTGVTNGKSELKRTFNQEKAVNAFEQAISIDPDNTTHKTNLAVIYAEKPPQDNPMKGILMLLDLDEKYPDDVGVLFQLARFGLQTNQFDKAIPRLERILEINPNLTKAHCLLADALEKTNKREEAQVHIAKCQS
jgi:tetratricopeptide (TPR) repeat protein